MSNKWRGMFSLRFVRFLMAGGLNTVATYGIYLVLINWLSYQASYTAAYIAGILISYRLNRTFVFRRDKNLRTMLLFPLVYVAQYAVGLIVMWAWIDVARLSDKLGPLVVVAITVPITYLTTRMTFLGTRKP